MKRVARLAEVLSDGEWHTNQTLVNLVGHRFGAQILQLRKGEYDGKFWNIEGQAMEGLRGVWKYRFVGFNTSYSTNAPHCPKCGTEMLIHDVRPEGVSA